MTPTPLVRLRNLFPRLEVFAKCEFLAPSGCFKIRGANHLLGHLAAGGPEPGRAVNGQHRSRHDGRWRGRSASP